MLSALPSGARGNLLHKVRLQQPFLKEFLGGISMLGRLCHIWYLFQVGSLLLGSVELVLVHFGLDLLAEFGGLYTKYFQPMCA